MTRSKIPLSRLSELTAGQAADCFVVLAERTRSTTREGKPYYNCRFRDARRAAACMIWADGPWYEACETEWREGQFYKIRIVYGEHERYGPQVELHNIRPATEADRAEGFDPAELIVRSRFDSDAMYADLVGIAAKNIADPALRRLVLTLLERHAAVLKQLPATERHFYPFAGGLLEHILSVTRSCIHLIEKYCALYPELNPPLNSDLVIAGAILHDLGRVREFAADGLVVQPTIAGRLFGHLFLGRDLVRDAAREQGDVNPELLQLLEHIIITHLTLPEWGSPRLPLIPECLILHHADDLDAKMEMYARCLRNDTSTGPFTDRDPALGKRLLKGRSV